jgi:NtrC-family two-component system sensor histidine kinase KinB
MNMNIKTKLTYGIGLLFVLITLLGGYKKHS